MASIANITINGNVGGEVRTREVNTQRGMQTVLNFTVATSHGYGERETTTWWSVDYFCRSDRARSRIVDQNINSAEFSDNFVYHRVYVIRIRDVATNGKGFNAVFLFDFLCDFFYEVLSSCNDDDVRALVSECLCHLNAEPRGAAGYDSDLSF